MVFDVFGRGSKTPQIGRASRAGQALHLLRFDEGSKKFTLGEEALDCLRAVKGPVGVLSVCGRARQGKSFILNQLAGAAASNDAGFKVGPTVKPCTKGLWIWSAPIPTRSSDGQAYHLILLDTEGIDAYDQTGQYSTQIFSMAVLLSSLFVYNQMGGIDEAALDRLSLVTEMTKHIRVRSDEGGGRGRTSAAELGRFSPSFVWLLRDFYLDLADSDVEGGPSRSITPAEYLERALRARRPGRARRGGEERDSRLHQGSVPRARVFPARAPGERRASVAQLGHHPSIGVATGVHRRFRAIDRHALLAVRAETHRARRDGPGARVARRGRGGAQRRRRARHRQRVAERRGGGVPQSRGRGARGVRRGVPRGVYRRRRRRRRRRARRGARRRARRLRTRTSSAPRGPGPRRDAFDAMDAELSRRKEAFVEKRRAERASMCASRLASAGRGSAPSPTPPAPPPTAHRRRRGRCVRRAAPTPGSARGATRSSWRGCGTSR